ncbi:hypothetical protein M011DRAFT_380309, partial [Sporormia fimetaria CBS 119925]
AATTGKCAGLPWNQIPTFDIACAVGSIEGVPSSYQGLMEKCCNPAPVVSHANGCGFYCLAANKPILDLTICFMDAGIRPDTILCNGAEDARASGNIAELTKKPSPTSKVTGSPGSSNG